MKVLSLPHLNNLSGESGINTAVRKHFQHAKQFGIQFVGEADEADVALVHAGMMNKFPDVPVVSFIHGLYWTADYDMPSWAHHANAKVIASAKAAREIIVPSRWVAESFERDMLVSPHVVPHGIDWDEWQHDYEVDDYVLAYGKNRAGMDVCDPTFLTDFSKRFPRGKFLATFARSDVPGNVQVTGLMPADTMKRALQRALVYINTPKETWGITMVEAMAAGTPVLAFNHGGAAELVVHGETGYLAAPGDYDDLEVGLRYCIEHRSVLSANAREHARQFTWERAMSKLAEVLRLASSPLDEDVTVVIPVYNKESTLKRAVESVMNQTRPVAQVIVVDDGSTDDSAGVAFALADQYDNLSVVCKENGGVAEARNTGLKMATTRYVCCLDADDWLDERFMEATVPELTADPSLSIAYTGLTTHFPDGSSQRSQWPGEFDADRQFNYDRRQNQIPTCCVFRRKDFAKTGGYRSRYCPQGAGTEDTELWTRILAYGGEAKLVTSAGLFNYSHFDGQTKDKDYREVDWLRWHPFTRDKLHPFGSPASPQNRIAHHVRQYDEPTISVIIPVGPGHVSLLENALDSLMAQTFRKWEAVLVFNNLEPGDDYQHILERYPFVHAVDIEKCSGAGEARNFGADVARGDFLLFLDADDWLFPEAMSAMIAAWNQTSSAVYTDYIGAAYVENLNELSQNLTVLDYNDKTKLAHIKYRAANFDCDTAVKQPETGKPPYLWCNVTTLVPRAWHYEIGGFDETMPSWEDVLYWWKLAWSGKCFVRVPEPLMVYRFHSGSRRETGQKLYNELLEHMAAVKQEVDIMGCNCGKKKKTASLAASETISRLTATSTALKGDTTMQDSNMIRIQYMHQNKGSHPVIGAVTRTHYGYRRGGDIFLMHRSDIEAQPHLFVEQEDMVLNAPKVERTTPPPTPVKQPPKVEEKPVAINEEPDEAQLVAIDDAKTRADIINPQLLPGVSPTIAKDMEVAGLKTYQAIIDAGMSGLTKINGLGPAKAGGILKYVKEKLGE